MAKYRLIRGTHSAIVGGRRVEYVAEKKGHDIIDLTAEQAKLPHLRKRIEKVYSGEELGAEAVAIPAASPVLDLKPDEDEGDETGGNDIDHEIAEVLAGNVDQVISYINDHADDEDTLTALRDAEQTGKKRKGVLDAINDLLGE